MKKLAFVLIVFACAFILGPKPAPLAAQSVPTLLKTAPTASAPTPSSADPLGRSTPSGTVFGFLQAAQDGNERAAADYLQMSAARRQSQGPDMAGKLKILMDSAFVGSLRRISTRPEGDPESGTINKALISKSSELFPLAIRMFSSFSFGLRIRMTERFGFFPPTRSTKSRSCMTTSRLIW